MKIKSQYNPAVHPVLCFESLFVVSNFKVPPNVLYLNVYSVLMEQSNASRRNNYLPFLLKDESSIKTGSLSTGQVAGGLSLSNPVNHHS